MPRIERTYPARDDLQQIWFYVAQHNLNAADRLIDRFEHTLQSLARRPMMGESADHFRAGLRRFTQGNYVLYYQPIDNGVRLIRVLHGARRIEDLLD